MIASDAAAESALSSRQVYRCQDLPQPVAFEVAVPRIDLFGEMAARHGKPLCGPLICAADRIIAVDALIVRQPISFNPLKEITRS